MKRHIASLAAVVVVLALSAAPVLADSHGGDSGDGGDHGKGGELANQVSKLHDQITSTLQNFVPLVQSDTTTLLTALGGTGATSVTASVYLPTAVTTDIATIQADVAQLQSATDPADVMAALQALQKQVERTKETLDHSDHQDHQGDGKDHEDGSKLDRVKALDADFEQWVTTLQTADQTMEANPTDKSDYKSAKKAWQHVQKDGRKLEEWSREWANGHNDH